MILGSNLLLDFCDCKSIMGNSKQNLVALADLNVGQTGDFYALLLDKNRGTTREGKAYYTCRFRDSTRIVSIMIWFESSYFADCESHWRAGQIYKLRGRYDFHERYGAKIDLEKIRPLRPGEEDLDPSQFIEHSRRDSEGMFLELVEIVDKEIQDPPLKTFVLEILHEFAPRWKSLPASRDRYYPFAGGLLEHTLQVTQICLGLAQRYRTYYTELRPPLNQDLIVAGAVLHDLGRILEFDDNLLNPGISIPGRLTGHLLLGRDLLRSRAAKIDNLNPELFLLLEHLLTSHLVLPEWGSPRLPRIPEVLILHHVYDLDAKLEMYVRCLTTDQSEGPFTERDHGLNQNLLKNRTV